MYQSGTLKSFLLTAVVGALGVAVPASATIVYNPSGDISNTFQQTQNNPCVIGDPSCNEPSGMTYTSNTGPGDYDLTSPLYTATSPFTTYSGNLIPTAFRIGIDSNISTGAGPQILDFFRTFDCGVSGAVCVLDAANTYEPAANDSLPNNNNGNGRSDVTLSGFALTAGHQYKFEAAIINATDGMEEFFIIPLNSPPVPEPVTSALVGTGLVALFFVRRRITGKA